MQKLPAAVDQVLIQSNKIKSTISWTPGALEQEKVVNHMLQEINKKATQGGF